MVGGYPVPDSSMPCPFGTRVQGEDEEQKGDDERRRSRPPLVVPWCSGPPSTPLGTIAKFASTDLERRAAGRTRRFARQSAARRLLPGERVAKCLRQPVPLRTAVDVFHHAQYQSASFGGLQVCGSPWSCPVCAQKIGERRREELERAIANHQAAGGTVVLATLTIAHTIADDLAVLLDAFLAAVRQWQSGGSWSRLRARHGLLGMVRSLEVTWGMDNGWHPHVHLLLFFDKRARADNWIVALEDELFRRWERVATRGGMRMDREHGLRLQETFGAVEDYLAKWGREPSRRPWGPGAELARAHTKEARNDRFMPFDLLDEVLETGELAGSGARFCEYVACFKGKSQLRWTPGLRALLLPDEIERDDDALARATEEDAVLLGMIELEDWRRVLRVEARAAILNAAASGEWDQVVAILARLEAEADLPMAREIPSSSRRLGEGTLSGRVCQLTDEFGDPGVHAIGAPIPIALE